MESMSQVVVSGTLVNGKILESGSTNNLANRIGMYPIAQSKMSVAFFFLFSFGHIHYLVILSPYLLLE
jgi:hypothetical protein